MTMKVMTMTKAAKRTTTTKIPKRPASTRLRLHTIQPINPVEPLDEAPIAPEPAALVLVVDEPVLVAPVVAVKPPRSEAETFGASAARYLRKHAKHPYEKQSDVDGIITLARQAWRAALAQLAVAEGQ
jgi:hypothetical protein